MRVLAVPAILAAIGVCLISPADARSQPPSRDAVMRALAAAGIAPAAVGGVETIANLGGGEAPSRQGYTSWVTVVGCDRAVLVRSSDTGTVREVFVPRGCRP